ncbi:GtrA family protein [Cupriavidus necator]|uniref:GtrA family protein n=1 Tax=Cupriavidus necator TaxID=106590 RepID=UPI00129D9313
MKQILIFSIIGVFNTAFGYGIIFFCMYALSISPEVSNIIGYIIPVGTSYLLNRRFTFESKQRRSTEFARFMVVFCVAYAVNFVTLVIFVRLLSVDKGLSQCFAGAAYVITSFTMSKYYAFRSAEKAETTR